MTVRPIWIAAAALAVMLLTAAPAFAYNEGGSADPAKTDCASCHAGDFRGGPHGGYSATTTRCSTCHSVHGAPGGRLLLAKATVSASCFSCHDGTGGDGVYGAIAARGLTPGGGHRYDATDTIPAGDPATGGPAKRGFSGPGGTLGCDDCHSPHGADTVAPFVGDRLRTADATTSQPSSRLLRRRPTGAVAPVAAYGSDWCGACHGGALGATTSGHNHPVETTATPGSYTYDGVPSLVSTTSAATVLAPLGQSNLGYLMPDPRTPLQQGHAPLCQQCHEDSRSLGQVGAASPFRVTAPNGTDSGDNPRFQGFPHETVNTRMLVETGDDLCTNCHSPALLP